jgi:hypothetical protein
MPAGVAQSVSWGDGNLDVSTFFMRLLRRCVCDNYQTLLKDASAQDNGRKLTTPTIQQFLRMVRNNTVLYQRSKRLNSRQVLQPKDG